MVDTPVLVLHRQCLSCILKMVEDGMEGGEVRLIFSVTAGAAS